MIEHQEKQGIKEGTGLKISLERSSHSVNKQFLRSSILSI